MHFQKIRISIAQFYTRAPATVENKVNGVYRIFDGTILGQFEKIVCSIWILETFYTLHQDETEIDMKWRKRDWADGVYSHVSLQFEEIEHGLTEVHLTQTNVPQYDKFGNANVVNNTTIGWMEQIFKQISMMLGYNLILEKDF